MTILRDLFSGLGNQHTDLARVAGAFVIMVYCALLISAHIRGDPFKPIEVGTGFTAMLAGVAAFIFAKDTARTAAISQVAKDETAAVVAGK